MRIRTMMVALLLGTGIAQAQVVSPLGGSTNNPQGRPPATSPAPATSPSARTPTAGSPTTAPSASTSPGAPASTAATPHRSRRTLAQRFDAANTTHDGKLTLEQAKAGRLVAVARDFAQIDKTKQGYVTLDQIKTHQTEQRAARRAAKAQKPAQTQ